MHRSHCSMTLVLRVHCFNIIEARYCGIWSRQCSHSAVLQKYLLTAAAVTERSVLLHAGVPRLPGEAEAAALGELEQSADTWCQKPDAQHVLLQPIGYVLPMLYAACVQYACMNSQQATVCSCFLTAVPAAAEGGQCGPVSVCISTHS